MLRNVLRMHRPEGRQPDFERFKRAITSLEPCPVPVGELFADFDTVGNFLGESVLDPSVFEASPDHKITPQIFLDGVRYVDQTIRFCLQTGWDYAWCFSSIPFKGWIKMEADNTSSEVREGKRMWVDDNRGPIMNWNDFEHYPWPTDFRGANLMSHLMAKRVPSGMKVLVVPGGVFEWTTWLMGLVPFSFALHEEPALVDAVVQKVSGIIFSVVEDLMDEPEIGGIFMGDDMGYASGTVIAPKILRQKFLPEMKKVIDLVHGAEKLFLLHSCGNLTSIMDDLIGLGIDGKHSFEDKIMPVEEVYNKWGKQTAIIGGVDVHLLTAGTEQMVRERTRQILDACGHNGHFVLGTGNSVTNYIPLKNYLAMLDEGRIWNKEHYDREH
jgi:uroporphyrinogen decarboxylase